MRSVFALCMALLMTGCVAGPDYRVPDAAIVHRPGATKALLGSRDEGVVQASLPPHWWHLYKDARLDAFVAEALAANTDLRTADANLGRADALIREAETARTVTTDFSGQTTGSRIGGPTRFLPAPFSYALGMNVSYPLDLAGGIRRAIEEANAQSEAAQAARDQVRVIVAATVTRNYARVCADAVALAAARHVVAVQRATLDVALRMANEGRGTRFDSERARTAAFASEAAIPDILADQKSALFALAAVMGRVPSDYPHALEACTIIPSLVLPLPVGDGAALLRRRPDIRKAERLFAAATAGIGVAEADLYPKVSLGGSVGSTTSITHALTLSSFGLSVGPLVSWSFPNRVLARARIMQAGAESRAALGAFDGTVLLALKQTETALSAYRRTRERLEDLDRAANSAGKASSDAETLQRFGRTPFLDVLNAQANYAEAQTRLSSARIDLVDRQIDLFQVLGGGWE
ncbi:TolC family protein [Gluconobacter sp. OJB]|uniref:TolC family protein n=1 Tax=Gluconobacter sp. OJB TaxID=3145196 RepID=UPI0031F7CDD9